MSKADIDQISALMAQLQQMRGRQQQAPPQQYPQQQQLQQRLQPQLQPRAPTLPVPEMLRDLDSLRIEVPQRSTTMPPQQQLQLAPLAFNPVVPTNVDNALMFQPNPVPPPPLQQPLQQQQQQPLREISFNPALTPLQQQQQPLSLQFQPAPGAYSAVQVDESMRFAPAEISLATSDQDPSTRPVEHKKFSQQGLRMRQRAVLNCKTPCTGTEKGDPWCFLGSKQTMDKVPAHELQGSDVTIMETNNGRDRWRHCKVKTNGDSYMKLDQATHVLMVQRANAIESIIDDISRDKDLKASAGLPYILMVHFSLEYQDALDLSACEFLSESEKMWTAGLWQFVTEFVKDRATTVSSMLLSKVSVDDWKQRLQKFMHGAKATSGDPLSDAMGKARKSGRGRLEIGSGKQVDDILGTFLDESESEDEEDEEDLEEMSLRQAMGSKYRGGGIGMGMGMGYPPMMDAEGGMDLGYMGGGDMGFEPEEAGFGFAPYPPMPPGGGNAGFDPSGMMGYGFGM